MTDQLASDGKGQYRVSGDLTFATVRSVLTAAITRFRGEVPRTIDFSAVTAADSAGLALLIEWFRWCAANQHSVAFVSVPAQLRALAKIGDVQEILPITE
jgi:phospholipid transport system transporter-binding protein